MSVNMNKPSSSEKEKFKILLEAGQIINSTLNIDEVLRRVMDKVIEILSAERGFIMLIDKATQKLVT
jgi:GAF domain-containing protein